MYWRVEIELFINDNTKSSQIQLLQILFGRLITKLLKIYFLCTYDDQTKKLQRFCIKLSFTNFSLVFFQLFSNFPPIFVRFMNYLKYIIKYLKHNETLVLIIITYRKMQCQKCSFLLYQMLSLMSTVNPGDYYLSMRLFKFETLEKV